LYGLSSKEVVKTGVELELITKIDNNTINKIALNTFVKDFEIKTQKTGKELCISASY
jgi:hypothetical protein